MLTLGVHKEIKCLAQNDQNWINILLPVEGKTVQTGSDTEDITYLA